VQEGSATRTSQASLSAALAAAGARTAGVDARHIGQDENHSLAEMAYRDLDATLQLLADRAQYITGSTGAAIALRRIGKNDMLCRASSGVNAPELGALLSSEFGLSGESVRRRQTLRCDDAERDVRVNRDVCRQMGIASVVVMPVVHDDEVLGVFELFSGKVNAFGERDLSALERLSGMVETAVKLAHAATASPDRFKHAEPAADAAMREIAEEPVLEVEAEGQSLIAGLPGVAAEVPIPISIEASGDIANAVPGKILSDVQSHVQSDAPSEVRSAIEAAVPEVIRDETVASSPSASKKSLFWSAASMNPEQEKPAEPDQSHVPMGLRNLRKCEACGFPVSASRALCVECEEKKWRGQLTVPQKNAGRPSAGATALTASVGAAAGSGAPSRSATSGSGDASPGAISGTLSGTLSGLVSPPRVGPAETRAFAATAQASAPSMAPRTSAATAMGAATAAVRTFEVVPAEPPPASLLEAEAAVASKSIAKAAPHAAHATEPAPQVSPVSEPELVLSAGLSPRQSWFASNKYIVGALLVVAAAVAAVFLLR